MGDDMKAKRKVLRGTKRLKVRQRRPSETLCHTTMQFERPPPDDEIEGMRPDHIIEPAVTDAEIDLLLDRGRVRDWRWILAYAGLTLLGLLVWYTHSITKGMK